jgi:hypothetical protein
MISIVIGATYESVKAIVHSVDAVTPHCVAGSRQRRDPDVGGQRTPARPMRNIGAAELAGIATDLGSDDRSIYRADWLHGGMRAIVSESRRLSQIARRLAC